jgi:hypothetical protein
MKRFIPGLLYGISLLISAYGLLALPIEDQIRLDTGVIEGVFNADTQVRSFKGIAFAAPPVGELRWRAPRPPTPWSGVRRPLAHTLGITGANI